MAERIDLPFGLWICLDRVKRKFNRIYQVAPMCPRTRAHLRHLANTVEPSVCSGDAALCQIALTTCFHPYYTVSPLTLYVVGLTYVRR